MYALNSDGTLKWSYKAGGAIDSSTAIASDGSIIFGCNDKYLYDLNSNGTLKWKYSIGYSLSYSSPTVGSDGTIYIGASSYYLYAVSSTGILKWKYYSDSYIYSAPAIAEDGTIILNCSNNNTSNYVHAVNNDGTLKWKYIGSTTPSFNMYASPVIDKRGIIFVGGLALNPNGSLRYKSDSIKGGSTAIAADGSIYTKDSVSFKLYKYDGETNPGNASDIINASYVDSINELNKVTLIEGQTQNLHITAIYSPSSIAEDTTDTVQFSDYDSSIININNGVVTALKEGNTTITATYNSISITIPVYVVSSSNAWQQGSGYQQGAYDVTAQFPSIFNSIRSTKNIGPSNPKLKWILSLYPSVITDILSYPAVSSDGTIYLAGKTSNRYGFVFMAINPNGTIKWTYSASTAMDLVSTTDHSQYPAPVIGADGTIYFMLGNEFFLVLNPDGTLKSLTNSLIKSNSTPVITNDGTIYYTNNGYLLSYKPGGPTEKIQITSQSTYFGYESLVIDKNGIIYGLCYGQYGYLFAFDTNSKTIIWSKSNYDGLSPGKGLSLGPDGTMYFGTYIGSSSVSDKIYAVNPDGSMKWTFDLGFTSERVTHCPVIGPDGTIYINTLSGK